MELYPLRTRLVKPRNSLLSVVEESFREARIVPRNGDILAVASKIISLIEGSVRSLASVHLTSRAERLGKQFALAPEFAQVVIDEADEIYGGVKGALLTLKNGQATANAGADRKNAPTGFVVLWPTNPKASAMKLKRALKLRTGVDLGVVVVDSRVTPLRLGTIGLSLASVGFNPVRDYRGKPDLYGRRVAITFQALGDGIAAAAHLLMGEARETVPLVLVRGAPVRFDGQRKGEKIRVRDCLYMSQIASASGKRI